MTTSFDDAVRSIISKGGSPAQADTPDQLTEQVNQAGDAGAQTPAEVDAPASQTEQEPTDNVASNQNDVQPSTGDAEADELAQLSADAKADTEANPTDDGGASESSTDGDPEGTTDDQETDSDPESDDVEGSGGDGEGESGGEGGEAEGGEGTGSESTDDEGDDPNADDSELEDSEDGFDVEAGDEGVELEDGDEDDLSEDTSQDDEGSEDNDGQEDDSQDDEDTEGEQSDTSTVGEESAPDPDEVSDDFQDPDDEGENEPESDDPENAAEDTETTVAEQAQATQAEQADNPAEHAASIIKESKEISDRLGELAEQIVDRHVLNSDEQQAPGATIPANEEPATQEDIESSVAVETIQARQYARNLLLQEASSRLGFAVESEGSGTVYHQANERVLENAISSLENLSRNNIASKLHLDTKIEAIEKLVDELEEVQEIVVDSQVLSDLHVQGSLSLDTLIYAPIYQRTVNELRDWLGSVLGVYLKSAEEGARAIVMPFTTGVLVENTKVAQVLRESNDLCSDAVSRILPGNRVMVYLKQDEAAKVLKVVRLDDKTAPKQITLTGTSIGSVKQALNELKLLAKVQQDSIRNIVALTNASKSILGWVQQADDDDLIRLNLPALLPMAYTPAISIHTAISAYIWSLVGVLEDIVTKGRSADQ